MKRLKCYRKKGRAQSLLEYTVFLSLILSALLIMQFYIKRSYQGMVKYQADQVGEQYSPGHTTALTVTKANTSTVSYTGGNYSEGPGPEILIADGVTVSYSQSNTTFSKQEAIDSYAAEDSQNIRVEDER
jgi:uncharacterized protein (UPF0333 family)